MVVKKVASQLRFDKIITKVKMVLMEHCVHSPTHPRRRLDTLKHSLNMFLILMFTCIVLLFQKSQMSAAANLIVWRYMVM